MRQYTIVIQVFPTEIADQMSRRGTALRIKAHTGAKSATEAAETILAAARAHWPSEWEVEPASRASR